jgi:hypothetical protein
METLPVVKSLSAKRMVHIIRIVGIRQDAPANAKEDFQIIVNAEFLNASNNYRCAFTAGDSKGFDRK